MKHVYYATVFVVRRSGDAWEFLVARRADGKYMGGTYQLVTGGIEPDETAWQAALRELWEEARLRPVEFYRLSHVSTFYRDENDAMCTSPMFCAVVAPDARVTINDEHTDFRWVRREEFPRTLMWPGDREALGQLCREILDDGPAKPHLRIALSRDARGE